MSEVSETPSVSVQRFSVFGLHLGASQITSGTQFSTLNREKAKSILCFFHIQMWRNPSL